jgi:hypothetical protein
MTPEELVEAAMRRHGIDPASPGADRELGISLRLNPTDASQAAQTVRRWRTGGGRNSPSFDRTILLLEAAGWLKVSADGAGPVGDELAARRQLTPLEEVAEQLRQQSALLEKLTEVVGRLDEQTLRLDEQVEALQERPAEKRPA